MIRPSLTLSLSIILAIVQQSHCDECTTPNGEVGSCVQLLQCQELLNILKAPNRSPQNVNNLQQHSCGFEGTNPKVCCPNRGGLIPPQNNFANLAPKRPSQDNPFLSNVGVNNRDPQASGGNPFLTNNNNNNNNQPRPNPVPEVRPDMDLRSNPHLPPDCGRGLSDRIIGGTNARLDEFPWMALLVYKTPNSRVTGCGGALITSRYVLTAGHCLKGRDLPATWRLQGVMLGEYNTDTDRDCIQDTDGVDVCSDDPIEVGVDEQIVHEDYTSSTGHPNDIALLRLSRNVRMTKYIKPICLPHTARTEETMVTAGWGRTETRRSSAIKQKVSLPLVEPTECNNVYQNLRIDIRPTQMCAGGEREKDSCQGDSGGPLMSYQRGLDNRQKWTVSGIVSFGPSPCGMRGWPGVYTRVFDYVPWILSKLRV